MDERMRFVIAASEEDAVMTEVCRRFGISRTIGYKWLQRYQAAGAAGLSELSRAPRRHGRARPVDLVETILALRERYPRWGPRKLRVKLEQLVPGTELPAASTIGDWLRKRGLTQAVRRRPRCPLYGQPFATVLGPNDLWSVDFKGWFRTGDRQRCNPLTLSDAYSRFLLRCQALDRPDHDHVRPVFEAAFCEFGLPAAIRSDNGAPFASAAVGGLSPLSVWWIKLGIMPERIEPGQPQQNGRHERMHRTLKEETALPPAASLPEQQARFDRFQHEFNEERPHEALGQTTPASSYRASTRSYPRALREPSYDAAAQVRRVRRRGEIKWGGELVFISEVLAGEPVGLEPTEHGEWRVCYGALELGFIDRRHRLRRRPLHVTKPPACGLVDGPHGPPTTPQAQQQQLTNE